MFISLTVSSRQYTNMQNAGFLQTLFSCIQFFKAALSHIGLHDQFHYGSWQLSHLIAIRQQVVCIIPAQKFVIKLIAIYHYMVDPFYKTQELVVKRITKSQSSKILANLQQSFEYHFVICIHLYLFNSKHLKISFLLSISSYIFGEIH